MYDTVLYFEPVFFERGMKLHTDGIQSGLWIPGDESRLRRMLEILLDNVQKYASPKASTWVTLQCKGMGAVCLPFQIKAIHPDSFGLGLPMLKALCSRYHIDLTCQQTSGSFELTLLFKSASCNEPIPPIFPDIYIRLCQIGFSRALQLQKEPLHNRSGSFFLL